LPSGLAVWERHCARLYRQWDLSLTGFLIDGYARELSAEGLDAYARFSPDGMVTQARGRQGLHDRMAMVSMWSDITEDDPVQAARRILASRGDGAVRFVACRSILKTPTWHAQIEQELRRSAADGVAVVDLHTLLALVKEYETKAPTRGHSR